MRRVVVFMKNIGRTLILLLWRVFGNGTAFLIVHIASYFEFVGLVAKNRTFYFGNVFVFQIFTNNL